MQYYHREAFVRESLMAWLINRMSLLSFRSNCYKIIQITIADRCLLRQVLLYHVKYEHMLL